MSTTTDPAEAWSPKQTAHLMEIYERLHAGKLGAHWLWVAVEQVAAGQDEAAVMREFGYVPADRAEQGGSP